MAIIAPVAPTTITPLPTPPSTSDPANFDPRADAFLGALPTNQTQLNAVGSNVYDNALKTYNSAIDSKTAAEAAIPAANTAVTSANTASASLASMQKLYLGAKASAPFLDNQGNPLELGAWYTNTTDGYWYWWSGSLWKVGVGDLTVVDWTSQVTGKPTTLSGYGITNAVTTDTVQNITEAKTFTKNVVGKASSTDAVPSFRATVAGGSYASAWNRRGSAYYSETTSNANLYAPTVSMVYNHQSGASTYSGCYSIGVVNKGVADQGALNILHINNAGSSTQIWSFDGASGNFTSQGDVTAFSDERLKYDWKPLTSDVLSRFSKVKYGTYTRKDTGQRQAGMSAQDMMNVIPETVHEDENGNLSLAYGNAALVICAELLKELTEVRKELHTLREVVDAIT